MSKVLLWEETNQHRKLRQIFKTWNRAILILLSLISIILLFVFFPAIAFLWFPYIYIKNNLSDPGITTAINEGYYLSIREALVTEYPHGIVYILKKVLEHLDRYNINYLPVRYQHDWLVHGWPNTTKLKEAIKLAQTLSAEWTRLNPTEQSQGMENIRSKIQTEDMYLGTDWKQIKTSDGKAEFEKIEYPGPNIKIEEEYYKFKIYKYYYDYEDYQTELQLNNSSINTKIIQQLESPLSKNSPFLSPSQQNTVINFNDWVNQNPALQHFSEAQQQKAYQKYLTEKGIKQQISFEEYLRQNPALEFFSLEEQQQAYQKYLQENH